MSHTAATPLARTAALLLSFFIVGCNASSITDSENEANEVRVTVRAIGSDYLDADDGIRYEITAATQYEGLTGLSDVLVGDIVEIEFEEIPSNTNRRALEVEADGAGNN